MPNQTHEVLSDETVRTLVESQAVENSIRLQELDLRRHDQELSSKHALEVLAAQATDRRQQRDHALAVSRNTMLFIFLIVLLVLIFAAVGLYLNKDSVVTSVLQLILGFAVGGVGGYGVGKGKTPKESE